MANISGQHFEMQPPSNHVEATQNVQVSTQRRFSRTESSGTRSSASKTIGNRFQTTRDAQWSRQLGTPAAEMPRGGEGSLSITHPAANKTTATTYEGPCIHSLLPTCAGVKTPLLYFGLVGTIMDLNFGSLGNHDKGSYLYLEAITTMDHRISFDHAHTETLMTCWVTWKKDCSVPRIDSASKLPGCVVFSLGTPFWSVSQGKPQGHQLLSFFFKGPLL